MWIKVAWTVIYAGLFLVWFLPSTFMIWVGKIHPMLIGCADINFATPITLPIFFTANSIIERVWGNDKEKKKEPFTTTLKRVVYRAGKTIRFAAPYWGLIFFIMFSFSSNFDENMFYISFFMPVYAIIQGLGASDL